MSVARSWPSPMIRKPSLLRSPQRRRASPPPPLLLIPARILVVLLVLWCEYGTFYFHVHSCSFDDSPSTRSRVWNPLLDPSGTVGSAIGEWKSDKSWSKVQPHHLLIASDPQILDMRSYPGRSWILRYLGVKFTDAYIRKAWAFVRRTRGQTGGVSSAVWLGDLLDSGVESIDRAEHVAYVSRFRRNFPPPISTAGKSPVPSVYVPGNHDLGLHLPSSALATYGRERFQEWFGPTNGQVESGGWDLTWVDAMALLEDGPEATKAREWVESTGAVQSTRPRILFSHIPLYRPEGTFCGKERESRNALHQGTGKNYQNELDEQTTKWLVDTLQPTLAYSGDDHDSCIVRHPYSAPRSQVPLIETTVKAFSMAMGVRRPGYHLLSLFPPIDATNPSTATYTQTNCTLPDQIAIWLHLYLPAYLFVVLSLLLPKLWRLSITSVRRATASARSNGLPVHRHRKSLSRQLLGGRRDDESEEIEDQDVQFPTFPFLPTSSDDYAYHSGLDSEDLPTSNHTRRPSVVDDEDDEEADVGSRVRRVSRVYMWENGSSLADYAPPSSPSASSSHRLLSRTTTSSAGHSTFEETLAWLGPLHRYLLRPVVRLLRRAVRKVWILPALARKVEDALLASKLGEAVVHTSGQVTSLIWPGLLTWTLVWIYFAL